MMKMVIVVGSKQIVIAVVSEEYSKNSDKWWK